MVSVLVPRDRAGEAVPVKRRHAGQVRTSVGYGQGSFPAPPAPDSGPSSSILRAVPEARMAGPASPAFLPHAGTFLPRAAS